jgi:hypothetical protein
MSQELETAGALSLGGFFRRGKHVETLPIGTPCPNCAAPLKGAWCYQCGQLAEDFHRSAAKLLFESFREFIDIDNRIWRTLPDLLFRPGRLTRSYLDGHRAPQVPPLRLFLVVLLALFLVGLNTGSVVPPHLNLPTSKNAKLNSEEAIKRIQNDKDIAPPDKREIINDIKKAQAEIGNAKSTAPLQFDDNKADAPARWLSVHIKNAIAHQSEFWQAVQNWAERFAVLMLPLAAILLSVLFVFQRRFFLFDHIIFSMHSLSFLCLLLTAMFAWNHYIPIKLAGWPLLAAPVHLFAHMRGVYQTSVFGTLFRMFLLFIGSAVGTTFIVLGLFWVALSAV